jgi:hypothetical protein
MGAAVLTVREFPCGPIQTIVAAITWTRHQMTAIPAEVVAAHRLVDQYHVIVRIGAGNYQGSFATLVFGDSKPLMGARYDRRVDLIYLQDPGLCVGQRFPLWSIQ